MNYWTDKRVLVTGGAGFIGRGLVSRLAKAGAKVTTVDDFSKGSEETVSRLESVRLIKGDLLRKQIAKKAMVGQEVCFHLAARIGGIGYFHRSPATILRDNSIMNFNVWDAAKSQDTKMVCLSSSMVFESAQKFPSCESDLKSTPPPVTGYGFSKLVSEYIAKTYHEEFGTSFLILRPFNAYGPGEAPGEYVGYSHVIPDLIRKALSGAYPLELLGDGNQTRSFTYVDDVTDAIIFLAERYTNEDFNIGSSNEVSITNLAKKVWELCGRRERFLTKSVPGYVGDVARRVPDLTKIRSTGWTPKVQLNEGLLNTVAWLKATTGKVAR